MQDAENMGILDSNSANKSALGSFLTLFGRAQSSSHTHEGKQPDLQISSANVEESPEHRVLPSEELCRWQIESGRTSNLDEQSHGNQAEMEQQAEESLRDKTVMIDEFSQLCLEDAKELKVKTRNLHREKLRWQNREREYERCIEQMRYRQERNMRKALNARSEMNAIQEQYTALIRKHQEESFQQMESGRWLPSEEIKVVSDLQRIKRDMRNWAKSTSVKNMPTIQDEPDVAALMRELSHVVVLEDNHLPQGLSGPKCASLLLNALLAHDLYTSLFRSPFFAFADECVCRLSGMGPETLLDEIYRLMQTSNKQDAHIWRSQTLRLLLPPLRDDASQGEKAVRGWTEGKIATICEQLASNFVAGPARHLIDHNAKGDYGERLRATYHDAATLSYQLWTRRTAMGCFTLRELGNGRPTFRRNDPHMVPHTLVRCGDGNGDHEDQLEPKPVSVIVHPLLVVYGTDESTNYDQHRVWAPAEVWFDSRTSPVL